MTMTFGAKWRRYFKMVETKIAKETNLVIRAILNRILGRQAGGNEEGSATSDVRHF